MSNTYYVSLDQKLPEAEVIRKSTELKYYQWVPFILLLEAFFFYIPNITWRALSRRSGIDMRDIVEAANNFKTVDKYDKRQVYMQYMTSSIDQYVYDPRRRKEMRHSGIFKRILKSMCIIYGKFLGNYLVILYMFIKILYIFNCIGQIFMLNLLLGHSFHKFGIDIIDKIWNGKGWDTTSLIFPKISMCDFRIREVGNPKISHRYTVQCVLPINLFNQQIFTFIWFWYNIILLINVYSLLLWSYRFSPLSRLRYIQRRVEIDVIAKSSNEISKLYNLEKPKAELKQFQIELIEKFVTEYLEPDGTFMLRVVSSNVSDFVCTQLIQELWKNYFKSRKFDQSLSFEDVDDLDDDDDDDDDNDDDEDGADEDTDKEIQEIQNTLYKESTDYEKKLKEKRHRLSEPGPRLSKEIIDDYVTKKRHLSILKNPIHRKPFKRSIFGNGNPFTKLFKTIRNKPEKTESNMKQQIYWQPGGYTNANQLNRFLSYDHTSVPSHEKDQVEEQITSTTPQRMESPIAIQRTPQTIRFTKFKETET